jgi:hypothetical protein
MSSADWRIESRTPATFWKPSKKSNWVDGPVVSPKPSGPPTRPVKPSIWFAMFDTRSPGSKREPWPAMSMPTIA